MQQKQNSSHGKGELIFPRERVRARSYQTNVYDIKAIFLSEQRTGHGKCEIDALLCIG